VIPLAKLPLTRRLPPLTVLLALTPPFTMAFAGVQRKGTRQAAVDDQVPALTAILPVKCCCRSGQRAVADLEQVTDTTDGLGYRRVEAVGIDRSAIGAEGADDIGRVGERSKLARSLRVPPSWAQTAVWRRDWRQWRATAPPR